MITETTTTSNTRLQYTESLLQEADLHPSDRALIVSSLEELEFPRVLEHIATMAISDHAKEMILAAFPTEDIAGLRQEHSRVEECLQCIQQANEPPMDVFPDVRSALQRSRISGSVLAAGELLNVRDFIRLSRLMREFLLRNQQQFPAIAELGQRLYAERLIEKHIGDAIDENGSIKDTATAELARIRRSIVDTSNRLRQRLQKLLRKVVQEDVVSDEFISQREGRFVLPMKTEYKRHIPGIIHSVSNSGATVFVEPAETFDMNNELSMLYNEERREIERLLRTLTVELGAVASEFLASSEILAHLDAAFAKARYASRYGGLKPVLVEEAIIELTKVRHPLLAQSKNTAVVPLSISFDGKNAGHIISGPNAGGKTVALKSIGLNIAMALSGIFPLGTCVTGYRSIFSSIGDNQSIENDVSTFSSQLLRLKEILNARVRDGLILVDEICSGTDPHEGSALAVGIMEGFLQRNAFFVVTTHQSSLKSYALAREGLVNASMEFNSEKLQPTYKFLAGVPGNSYAFILAKNIGLPPATLALAQEYLGDKHSLLEESIETMQKFRSEAETLRREAEQMKLKAEQQQQKYEQKFAEFKAKYNDLVGAARKEAAEIVSGANKLIEQTVRELREEKRPVADVKKEFEQEKSKIRASAEKHVKHEQKDAQVKTEEFAVDDVVVMEDYSTPGRIITLDTESGTAVVEFGIMKFKTDLGKLRKTDKKVPKQASSVEPSFSARPEIDVRGMYAFEAEQTVEKAIAEALTGNVHELTIIHGKGTGALRRALHAYAQKHPAVAEYRNGMLTEGGEGVTVLSLK